MNVTDDEIRALAKAKQLERDLAAINEALAQAWGVVEGLRLLQASKQDELRDAQRDVFSKDAA